MLNKNQIINLSPCHYSQEGNKKSGLKNCINTSLIHFSKEKLRKVSY